jgi:HK97 family phage portal protein
MSLFDGLGNGLQIDAARRSSIDDVHPSTGGGMFGLQFRRPIAGVPIDHDSALTYSAVWACTKVISEHIAMMPWRAFEKKDGVRQVADGSLLDGLLYRSPNDEMTSFDFRQQLILSALLQGNGLAEIERTRHGDPVAIWGIDWQRVNPDRDRRGRLCYDIAENNGPNTVLYAKDVIHLKGMGYDGLQGYSVVEYAKQCFSLGLATEQFGAAFFGNGAMPGGIIEWNDSGEQPDGWDSNAAKNMKSSWNKKHQGSSKHGGIEILEPGQKFKPISISPNEAQFLESRKFGINEVCRWFNVKPHKIADLERSTNSNIESQNIEHVTDTLLPWVTRLEQETDFKMYGRDTRRYSKINMSALLRGDLKARQEFYKTMLDRGVYCIDDVLAFEDMNPLENGVGQLRLVPMNMSTLEQAVKNGNTGKDKAAQDKGTDK